MILSTTLIHMFKAADGSVKRNEAVDNLPTEEAKKMAGYEFSRTLSSLVSDGGAAVKRTFKPEVYVLHKLRLSQGGMLSGLDVVRTAVQPYLVNGNMQKVATVLVQRGESLHEAIIAAGFQPVTQSVAAPAIKSDAWGG